jgi:hypothetical protein
MVHYSKQRAEYTSKLSDFSESRHSQTPRVPCQFATSDSPVQKERLPHARNSTTLLKPNLRTPFRFGQDLSGRPNVVKQPEGKRPSRIIPVDSGLKRSVPDLKLSDEYTPFYCTRNTSTERSLPFTADSLPITKSQEPRCFRECALHIPHLSKQLDGDDTRTLSFDVPRERGGPQRCGAEGRDGTGVSVRRPLRYSRRFTTHRRSPSSHYASSWSRVNGTALYPVDCLKLRRTNVFIYVRLWDTGRSCLGERLVQRECTHRSNIPYAPPSTLARVYESTILSSSNQALVRFGALG